MSIAQPAGRQGPDIGDGVFRRCLLNLRLWLWAALSSARLRPAQRRPIWGRSRVLLATGLGAFALIALSMLYLDALAIAEQRHVARPVVGFFAHVTGYGRSAWVLIPCAVAITLLAAACSPALGRVSQLVLAALAVRLGFLFAAVATPGLIVTLVKRLIGRARPYGFEAYGPLSFHSLNWNNAYASMPSGHSTSAFATAFALAALLPRWRALFWAFAVAIAVSRVAIGAHYPSDVVAGALVGLLGAIAVRNWFAMRRLGFVVAPDRSVRTMAGPTWQRLKRALARVVSR